MKKISLITFALMMSLISGNAFAQVLDEEQTAPRDSFYEKISFKQRKPFEFPYVREADVVWQWRIWRVIDFREKMNQVFYYPIDPQEGKINLYTAIDQAVANGKIRIYADDEFKNDITDKWEEVKKSFAQSRTVEMFKDDIDGTQQQYDSTIVSPITAEDIKTLRIKEDWFIDKNRSVQDVRIEGFAFIYNQIKEEGAAPIKIPLCWVRYNDPEVRDLLANTEVYNFQNDVQRRSYDDIFLKRSFASYIIRESNVYDRAVSSYTAGDETLQEADNIRDKIFDIEEDMWEY